MTMAQTIAPGAQILVRDALWRVLQVNRTSNGKNSYHVVGVSEIVRDQDAIFLEEYEPFIEVIDAAETRLEADRSPGHRDSLLYMESFLRDVPPTGPELHIGHGAAMDVMDYQLVPARLALSKTRQRILIADAVGLGKTLEAGILMSELIRRGRGKRILVATVKSMLTQFQKEMWCRFSIPLVRLDSVGLQRVRQHIPTNHNPFYHYDKAIISIDTLKQDNAFRTHVESAWWDIIVIDEAHNVAARGTQRSQRARVAEILAERSDALILLSATPHDGKARSFASLMNMLDPTAIANPDSYTKDDIEGLFVRRFKSDVQEQMGKAFPDRVIAKAFAQASGAEDVAFAKLVNLSFTKLDQQKHGGMLFKTTLEKALFSSPAACKQTIEGRISRLQARKDANEFAKDIEDLQELSDAVSAIDADAFSKYHKLKQVIKKSGWQKSKKDDRLVIFSERIETLRFLEAQLSEDLKLKPDQVQVLHGGSDMDQQAIVEDFGKLKSKVRLLLASDVAAEGLNLHYLCHRLIHFDIPWSLMLFQQRNGRIDRYGQEHAPEIYYLLTDTTNPEIKGDTRILELLIERDKEATKNIGDPSALMGVFDIDEQEQITATAIEDNIGVDAFAEQLGGDAPVDLLALLLGGGIEELTSATAPKAPLSLFSSDFEYVRTALERLADVEGVQHKILTDDRLIELTMPEDSEEARRARKPALELRRRFNKLPREILPADGVVVLSPSKDEMQRQIAEARREENTWPRLQYLWPLNPVVQWCNDKGRAAFGRHTAPVISLLEGLAKDEFAVVVSGLIPNRRSQPLVHRWYTARFRDGDFAELEDFGEFAARLALGRRKHPNRKDPVDLAQLQSLVPIAVERAREAMLVRRDEFEKRINVELQAELDRLEALRKRQLTQLELDFEGQGGKKQADKDRRTRRVNRIFDRYLEWIQDSMTTEPAPFLQVIAALRAEAGYGGAG